MYVSHKAKECSPRQKKTHELAEVDLRNSKYLRLKTKYLIGYRLCQMNVSVSASDTELLRLVGVVCFIVKGCPYLLHCHTQSVCHAGNGYLDCNQPCAWFVSCIPFWFFFLFINRDID